MVALSDVTLCGNREEGLRQKGGSAQIVRATVTQNRSKGLAINGADQVVVQDATIGSNGDNGVQVLATAACRSVVPLCIRTMEMG